MRFWLGTHEVRWLEMTTVPLFVSRTRLAKRRSLPVARGPWALDSGGFTQLDKPPHRWTVSADEYAEQVARFAEEIGGLAWAAPQDWMCEPWIIEKTGLSVREHQDRTVENFLALRDRGPFVPVLQGWSLEDYERCVELYAEAGVDLLAEPLVGLGTVCRRQDTPAIAEIVGALAAAGMRLHGFGVKTRGLRATGHLLASADSLAWSIDGRWAWSKRQVQKCGGAGEHRGGCANCLPWALGWRERIVDGLGLFAEVA